MQEYEPTQNTIQVCVTEDGSHTLFVESLNEHYHSTHGAIRESMHVFIQSGLEWYGQTSSPIHIVEVGFGTGLNALLTACYCHKQRIKVHYTSIEKYPLPPDVFKTLNYTHITQDEKSNSELFNQLHEVEWNRVHQLSPSFTFHKLHTDVRSVRWEQLQPSSFQLVFFDAFAPDKQPELWTEDIFKEIYQHMSIGGALTTYCAKGEVRRRLQRAGFLVERLPGPPGKREMLRACKK